MFEMYLWSSVISYVLVLLTLAVSWLSSIILKRSQDKAYVELPYTMLFILNFVIAIPYLNVVVCSTLLLAVTSVVAAKYYNMLN